MDIINNMFFADRGVKMDFRKVALLGAFLLAGGAAQASTISLVGDRVNGQNVTPNYVFGTATCSIGCQGVIAGGLSSTTALAQDFGNANETTEVNQLNALLGLVPPDLFTVADANREGNASPFTFSGQYVALKVGQMTAYLFNSAGVEQTVTYSGNPAGGLSHKTFIGELPPTPTIPLPAAGWLLIAGLGGLVAMRKRKA